MMKNVRRLLFSGLTGMVFLVTLNLNSAAQSVTQDLGILDVEFSGLNKGICQDCHGESLVNDHHGTAQAKSGNCVACHGLTEKTGIKLTRNCMDCHKESPHHQTEAAINKECSSCHDSPGVSDFSTTGPDYGKSAVTPKVSSCIKCHNTGTQGDFAIISAQETHHSIAIEDCSMCHDESDQTKTDIRLCERCHSAASIHDIAAHTLPESCIICHAVN